jgi:hypothetical protein
MLAGCRFVVPSYEVDVCVGGEETAELRDLRQKNILPILNKLSSVPKFSMTPESTHGSITNALPLGRRPVGTSGPTTTRPTVTGNYKDHLKII